jgi:O-antigen biosynthesis protein WbqP
MKRATDFAGSAVGILALLPVYAMIAVVVLLDDGRPVFHHQHRIGQNGRQFVLLKFRTMPVGTKELPSTASDLRVTRAGRLLRRSSLDELPQLFNVALGDMSLVGPRPALASQIELLNLRESSQAFHLRPGITGLAQVNSFDGMTETKKAQFDAVYSRHITFIGDVSILAKTIWYLRKPPPIY